MTNIPYKSEDIPPYVSNLRDSLPEEITSSIETNPRNEKPYRLEVANHLLTGGRPYYSSARIASDLDVPQKKETVQKRLDYLCDRGVAKSENVGDMHIYWFDSDKSAWPVPPDVEVTANSALPVSEFVAEKYRRTTLLGIAIVCLGSIATWGGGALLATGISSTVSFVTIAFGLVCLPIGLSIFATGFARHFRDHHAEFGSEN